MSDNTALLSVPLCAHRRLFTWNSMYDYGTISRACQRSWSIHNLIRERSCFFIFFFSWSYEKHPRLCVTRCGGLSVMWLCRFNKGLTGNTAELKGQSTHLRQQPHNLFMTGYTSGVNGSYTKLPLRNYILMIQVLQAVLQSAPWQTASECHNLTFFSMVAYIQHIQASVSGGKDWPIFTQSCTQFSALPANETGGNKCVRTLRDR